MSKTPATGIMYKVRIIDRTIWRLEIKRDSLKSCLLPGAVRYDLDKVQTSPEDRFSLVMAEVADLDSTIQELKRAKAEAIMDIWAQVSTSGFPVMERYSFLVFAFFFLTILVF